MLGTLDDELLFASPSEVIFFWLQEAVVAGLLGLLVLLGLLDLPVLPVLPMGMHAAITPNLPRHHPPTVAPTIHLALPTPLALPALLAPLALLVLPILC